MVHLSSQYSTIDMPILCNLSFSHAFPEIHESCVVPKDCSDIRALGYNTSGVYRVYPGSLDERIQVDVYCDMTTPGGNWLVSVYLIKTSLQFKSFDRKNSKV